MNKLTTSIFFAACLVLSACTVHHYHHDARSGRGGGEGCDRASCPATKGKGHGGKSCKGHGGKSCKGHGLPAGHPPVDGHHGMPKGHPPVHGHGSKGNSHALPEGHPPVHGHGGMVNPHGKMKGHPHRTHTQGTESGADVRANPHTGNTMQNPFHGGHGHDAEHEKLHANLPPAVKAFHDSFAPVWHTENEAVRSTAACAKTREWDTLAKGVVAHKADREQAVSYSAAAKTLAAKLKVVSASCRKKQTSVQVELTAAHDALHDVLKALAQ